MDVSDLSTTAFRVVHGCSDRGWFMVKDVMHIVGLSDPWTRKALERMVWLGMVEKRDARHGAKEYRVALGTDVVDLMMKLISLKPEPPRTDPESTVGFVLQPEPDYGNRKVLDMTHLGRTAE